MKTFKLIVSDLHVASGDPLLDGFGQRQYVQHVIHPVLAHYPCLILFEPALSFLRQHISYRALLSSIHQTANLLADLGLGPQDVIALLLPCVLETHVLLWGGQAAGIVCPIPCWLPAQQLVDLLQATKAKILVAPGSQMSPELWQKTELARRKMKSIPMVLQVQGLGQERDGAYGFDVLLADYQASHLETEREISPDDIAVYFPTRDTSGALNLVSLSHGNLLYAAWALGFVTTVRPEEVLLCGLSRFIQEGGG